ncbi:MAG: 4-(cytidine 5'-diphospho)-2-C-methyl-D-erythritol kinase [Bacteroidota bacterium]|nr:4-(cytidine 5'-diphospho)-2-C-methyl-D-erythritol kinase [Bacteroidota bacterium]MDP4236806.1 4-(cytidine 5'-diphospho)-2-C-methyl-D-erythritol kinase [Bacteroidota bacterium]
MENSYHSPCKINIGLEVLSKRDDGYHNINTVFYKLNEPHDEITVQESEFFRFTSLGHDVPSDENNIVVKAIALCSEFAGVELPQLHLYLGKHIPSGAGLGGGSANAATAIRIFSERCKSLTQKQMLEIGRKLGADVPFFLFNSQAAVARGIGDKLLPITFHMAFPILIIKLKDVFISTAKAYSMLRIKDRNVPTDFTVVLTKAPDPRSWRDIIVNDFEEVAFALHPNLFSLKERLYESGAEFAQMSGSGSAFFGIFKDRHAAGAAHEKLLSDYPGSSVFLSQ